MMATDTRPVVHTPWCNDHSGPTRSGIPNEPELCSWEKGIGGSHFVNVEQGQDGGSPYVAAWGNGDPLTPEQARTMAAALVEAAALAEGHSATTARLQRNLAAAVAAWQPIPVDATEAVADALGINVVDLWEA